jgi:hypothetical protein
MINWLVKSIFGWESLRNAVTDEVHMYDMIGIALEETGSAGCLFWNESDGWRGWDYDQENKRYYFHDIPEQSISDMLDIMLDRVPQN